MLTSPCKTWIISSSVSVCWLTNRCSHGRLCARIEDEECHLRHFVFDRSVRRACGEPRRGCGVLRQRGAAHLQNHAWQGTVCRVGGQQSKPAIRLRNRCG